MTQPNYVHNPYLDGGAYGNSVDANRIGTSALTIGLDPAAARAVNPGGPVVTGGGSPSGPTTRAATPTTGANSLTVA